jgi:molecular chaperone Hsp33
MNSMHPTSDQDMTASSDISRRFLFQDADIRGETVHLEKTLTDILDIHRYPPAVAELLGEFLAAAVLLSTTLKFDGKLILQVRSDGQIPLLMVECTNLLHIRAIARGAEKATASDFDQLLTNGQLAITVDPKHGRRYQSIVPLAGGSLAQSLDAYFEQSEQLSTRFWLTSDQGRAAGMLLQQLPSRNARSTEQRKEDWQHACALAATIQAEELLRLSSEQLLYRLYHEQPPQLFEPSSITFQCNCSAQRTQTALATLNPTEIEEILIDQGAITMDCEFCNEQYRFTRADLSALLAGDGSETDSKTLH